MHSFYADKHESFDIMYLGPLSFSCIPWGAMNVKDTIEIRDLIYHKKLGQVKIDNQIMKRTDEIETVWLFFFLTNCPVLGRKIEIVMNIRYLSLSSKIDYVLSSLSSSIMQESASSS